MDPGTSDPGLARLRHDKRATRLMAEEMVPGRDTRASRRLIPGTFDDMPESFGFSRTVGRSWSHRFATVQTSASSRDCPGWRGDRTQPRPVRITGASALAGWARCIGRSTRSSTARWPSRSCPPTFASGRRASRSLRARSETAGLFQPSEHRPRLRLRERHAGRRLERPLPRDGTGRRRGPLGATEAGAIPVDEALAIAKQIAEALEEAHATALSIAT